MTIESICCREVDTASAEELVRVAARRMATRAVGTLVVTDAANQVLGILSDRDVAVRCVGAGLDPDTTRVADVMSDTVHTCFEHMPVEEAIGLMRSQTVRRLVVVRRDGTLAGIVSLDDVLTHVSKEMDAVGELLRDEAPRQALTR